MEISDQKKARAKKRPSAWGHRSPRLHSPEFRIRRGAAFRHLGRAPQDKAYGSALRGLGPQPRRTEFPVAAVAPSMIGEGPSTSPLP